jgi:hypothetical protein
VKRRHKLELEVEPGRLLRQFTEDEALQFTNQWINVYAQNAQGANLKAFLWHTFSSGAYPSVCKQEAERLYAQQLAAELVVLSNDRRSAVLTDALPTKCDVMDFLVFPTNLAWTMAFTHEDGWLGPYFAKHKNYDALVAQELERVRAQQRKAAEIEHAKQKGWL